MLTISPLTVLLAASPRPSPAASSGVLPVPASKARHFAFRLRPGRLSRERDNETTCDEMAVRPRK
ncbi:MAG: hypothetical protein K1Y01_17740 [Vicinamibacteria bacterium]|nr:hypothetical protein [Vicinamibacteria bacterium]